MTQLLTRTERYDLRAAVRAEMDRRHLTNQAIADCLGLTLWQVHGATRPAGQGTGRLIEIATWLGVTNEKAAMPATVPPLSLKRNRLDCTTSDQASLGERVNY